MIDYMAAHTQKAAHLRFVTVGKYRNLGPYLVQWVDDTELSQAIIRAAIRHGKLPDQVMTCRLQHWTPNFPPSFVLTDGHRETLAWGTLEAVEVVL